MSTAGHCSQQQHVLTNEQMVSRWRKRDIAVKLSRTKNIYRLVMQERTFSSVRTSLRQAVFCYFAVERRPATVHVSTQRTLSERSPSLPSTRSVAGKNRYIVRIRFASVGYSSAVSRHPFLRHTRVQPSWQLIRLVCQPTQLILRFSRQDSPVLLTLNSCRRVVWVASINYERAQTVTSRN